MIENLIKYEAALLLRKTLGKGCRRICKILNEIGFIVSENTIRRWLYHNKASKGTSPLIKALFYSDAYALALKLKDKNPLWGERHG